MKTIIFKLILVCLIAPGLFQSSIARIIRVPADQPTIQAGIQASANGDTVLESVILKVTDLSGRMVSDCTAGLSSPGFHQFQLDVSGLQQGIYLYCMESGEHKVVRQMIIVR